MIRTAFILAVAIGLFLTVPAWSAPPQINNMTPLGGQRGVATELTISGSNLAGNPRLIAAFGFQLVSPTAAQGKSDASNWKLKLTIAPTAAVGVYPIRVQTDDGISNPYLWVVGQLPQIAEKEDNSTFEVAQSIPDPPLVVEGQVAGNDVDFFRFHGKKGQFIVVDAQCARIGSGIDPTIRLTMAAASRAYIASADDSPGLATDARLTAVLPADADYVVEISDSRYQGAARPVYRLLIGAVPMAEEIFPLGGRAGETVGLELRGGNLSGVRIAAATLNPPFGSELFPARINNAMLGTAAVGAPVLDVESLAPLVVSRYPELREAADPPDAPVRAVAPVVFNGRIDPPGDNDRFVLATAPGVRLRIKVEASELGSALDGVLQVLGSKGAVIANADDTVIPLPARQGQQAQSLVFADPSLDFTVPGGTNEITLVIRDLENRGGVGFPYRIVVEPHSPDFQLLVNDPQVSIPRGGAAAVRVTVRRTGYSGPITVTVADPPPGLTVRAGTIAAGQSAGVLTLSAAAEASFPAAAIKLVGRGQGENGPFERLAFKPVVYAQQTNLPMCTINHFGLVAAPASAAPVAIETPPAPIEVPHGFSATIPVKVVRTKGADSALAIAPLPLPAGITIAGATIAEKASEGKVMVKAAVAAPLGTMTIVLQAKGRFAGAERTLDLPAVTLTVVSPALVELAAPAIEVKAGATVELKGKIVRKGTFDAPVTVKINGLPAGLKAEPVTVAGGASNFVVKVVADAKAAATSAGSQVALAFQVEKKDYPVPPTPLAVKVLPLK
ncbi:MAG: hypothetical protein ACHRXM_22320 [Isosphaerales bacterium]